MVSAQMELSLQQILGPAYQQDPGVVEEWKQGVYPQILRLAAVEEAVIFFGEECGKLESHIISATSPQGQLHFWVFDGSPNADHFVNFLYSLLQSVRGKVFLIVGDSPVHRAQPVREFTEKESAGRLRLFFLPPQWPRAVPGAASCRDFPAAGTDYGAPVTTPPVGRCLPGRT
jgi:hypothetical protein